MGGPAVNVDGMMMHHAVRNAFPWLALLVAAGALGWAVSFGTLPPADFVFNNEDEVKSVDPSKATGTPEHRILSAIFEGLLRLMPADQPPDADGVVPLEVVPGVAELPDISQDRLTYSFRLRPNAQWSNGDPVTAHDFVWSWRRTLHPDTASEYAYQLHYLEGAREYQEGSVAVGDRVEVELADRRDPLQPFPRGTMVRGTLKNIQLPPDPAPVPNLAAEERDRIAADRKRLSVYTLEEKARGIDGELAPDWDAPGRTLRVSKATRAELRAVLEWKNDDFSDVVTCTHVLLDFDSRVGVRAADDHTLIVKLHSPTPFFQELTTFYPLSPMNRRCVEQFGSPAWTKPENIVTNGTYLLADRRIRDRIRLVKNPRHWDAANVRLEVIDALPIKSRLTGLNMFLSGELDWNHAPPGNMIPFLKDRPDYVDGPALITYFYRLNVARDGLRDKRVRQALSLAMDKQAICTYVTQAGERPAQSFVPRGMPGYESPRLAGHDPNRARQLLEEAGYPGGRNFPKLQILYNSDEMHKAIAEVIQQQWKKELGIQIELHGIAWPAYLEQMHKGDFDICRAGWVPDYTDPNTFLDIFVTGGLQNGTNWGNPQYDRLIRAAGEEPDEKRRMQLLHDAEALLLDEMPLIPIYNYVGKNMVQPRVRGFHPNVNDFNPLYALSVEDPRNESSPRSVSGILPARGRSRPGVP